MSQPTPKADQLRALREAKFSKRGKDAQANHGNTRASGGDAGRSKPPIHATTATKGKVRPGKAASKKAKGVKVAARRKKQTVRKQGPADR